MTRFDTLKELIDYCLLCPICNCKRNLEFSIGPDTPTPTAPNFGEEDDTDLIRLTNCQLTDDHLLFEVKLHLRNDRYQVLFVIDTNTNQLETTIKQLPDGPSGKDGPPLIRATAPRFFFLVYANCGQCHHSSLNTHDINLDILSKAVYPLSVEYESRSVLVGGDGFQLEYLDGEMSHPGGPVSGAITVCRLQERSLEEFYDGPHPDFERIGQPVHFPMTEFDFSDIPALHKRLSTLIFFS